MHDKTNIDAAKSALNHGYQPIPVRSDSKRPHHSSWTHSEHDLETVDEAFKTYAEEGAGNIGLLLGSPSNGLIDIDLDHPKSLRLKDHFLPRTAMKTGRAGRPASHFWYRVEDDVPGTRRYKMPDKSVSVELRSTGAQTLIPPSIWYPKKGEPGEPESYRWEGDPWAEPAVVDGQVLAVQVALLGMGCVLLENWPKRGSRHDAYLALAGGLLRFGHEGVHPYWEKNIVPVIRTLAIVTNDDDGPDARVQEVVQTTIIRLREDGKAMGFPRLGEMIGEDHAELVRRMAKEVESLAGFTATPPPSTTTLDAPLVELDESAPSSGALSSLPPEERNPLDERTASWEPVDLDPYLAGEIVMPEPSVLRRSDGHALIYPGRLNVLYGRSESAKSWVALYCCIQEIALGERVMYLDFEDEPSAAVGRLTQLGVGPDDIRGQFTYIRPEEPLSAMQWDTWGNHRPNEIGSVNMDLFRKALLKKDPSLIVADGMTVLYGLHGLNSNDATATDIISNWLKKLTRNGRTTVIVIDHVPKGTTKGTMQLGSQHKTAMIQGVGLQVHVIEQPAPGVLGHMQLVVGKDRPGAVRKISSREEFPIAAEVFMDSRTEGITRVKIDPPDLTPSIELTDDQQAEKTLAEELEPHIIATFGGDLDLQMAVSEIEERMKKTGKVGEFSRPTVNRALQSLKVQAVLESVGVNRWCRYNLVPPGD